MPLPRVDGALWGLGSKITFSVVTKALTDYENDEDVGEAITFIGVLQPIKQEQIDLKPEGQRSWKWWTLWTKQRLETDWIIQDQQGLTFRVMEIEDWRSGGYRRYGLRETFSD